MTASISPLESEPARTRSSWTRVLPVFSIAFVVVYVISMVFHPSFTLFTYAPRLKQWFTGIPALGNRGPGMFWYSWLTTAGIGGALAAIVALAVPTRVGLLRWSGWTWIVPVLLVIFVGYELRPWFGFR